MTYIDTEHNLKGINRIVNGLAKLAPEIKTFNIEIDYFTNDIKRPFAGLKNLSQLENLKIICYDLQMGIPKSWMNCRQLRSLKIGNYFEINRKNIIFFLK